MRTLSVTTLLCLLVTSGCGDSPAAEVVGEPQQDATRVEDSRASTGNSDANLAPDDALAPADANTGMLEDTQASIDDTAVPDDSAGPIQDASEPAELDTAEGDSTEAGDIDEPQADTSETADSVEPGEDTAEPTDAAVEEDATDPEDGASADTETTEPIDATESPDDAVEADEDASDEDTTSPDDVTDTGPCPQGSDGLECDDDDPCTINDMCSAGVCSGDPKDVDQDGFVDEACGGLDCNDESEFAFPGAIEVCDGIKNNCTPKSTFGEQRWESEDLTFVCGYCNFATITCELGEVLDYVAMCWPGHAEYTEMCGDGVDNNCDGDADEGCDS